MEIVKYMQDHGHEQLVVCSEPSVRLRALVAIHDTTLGPAVGGAAYMAVCIGVGRDDGRPCASPAP